MEDTMRNTRAGDVVIDTVSSLCPQCGKLSLATIFDREGKVYQRSECSCHTPSEDLIFSDTALYHRLEEWNKLVFPKMRATEMPSPTPCAAADTGSENEPCLAVIDITN